MTSVPSGTELTVAQLSGLVAGAIRGLPKTVVVRAVLADIGRGYAGHVFAVLRDDTAAVRCFVHARVAAALNGVAEGDTVVVRGRVALYKARGDIQLVADTVELVDESTRAREAAARMQVALEREGVLGANRRLRMPELPRAVAVVGGHSSAAVLDIVTALHRRAPWVGIGLYPTRLQGEGAHQEIANAITAAASSGADVVALVRGGGASSDFAPFDEAVVCRAIAAAGVPVVSALGHEQDRRMADLAAHTAASTPSDAARHVVRDVADLRLATASARRRMANALVQAAQRVQTARTAALKRLSTSAQLLTTRVRARAARVCLDQRISRVAAGVRARHAGSHDRLRRSLPTLSRRASALRDAVLRTEARNATALRTRVASRRDTLDVLRHQVQVAHPLHVVARGYVIARDRNGNVIADAGTATSAGWLELQFRDRTVVVTVSTTSHQ